MIRDQKRNMILIIVTIIMAIQSLRISGPLSFVKSSDIVLKDAENRENAFFLRGMKWSEAKEVWKTVQVSLS